MTVLEEIRGAFRKQLLKGKHVKCPCCDRKVKIYRRKLNAGMALLMLWAYRYTENKRPAGGWIHVSKVLLKGKVNAVAQEYSKLRFWGLLEPADEGSSASGYWRVTEAGSRFARGETRIPRHAIVYDNNLLELDNSELASIRGALGDKFDFDELMRGDVKSVYDKIFEKKK
jgi:hypothetical protein